MPRRRTFEVGAALAGIALVGIVASLRASQSGAPASIPSTFDTGPQGYAALYDLLRGEGVQVSRFDRSVRELSGTRGTLVIAGNDAIALVASSSMARSLDSWVRAGGKLVVLASRMPLSRTLGLEAAREGPAFDIATPRCAAPAALLGARIAGDFLQRESERCGSGRSSLLATPYGAVAAAAPRGRGAVVQIRTPSVFDNAHLPLEQNARVAYALFSADGPVWFDEFLHGYAAEHT